MGSKVRGFYGTWSATCRPYVHVGGARAAIDPAQIAMCGKVASSGWQAGRGRELVKQVLLDGKRPKPNGQHLMPCHIASTGASSSSAPLADAVNRLAIELRTQKRLLFVVRVRHKGILDVEDRPVDRDRVTREDPVRVHNALVQSVPASSVNVEPRKWCSEAIASCHHPRATHEWQFSADRDTRGWSYTHNCFFFF